MLIHACVSLAANSVMAADVSSMSIHFCLVMKALAPQNWSRGRRQSMLWSKTDEGHAAVAPVGAVACQQLSVVI